ncbi:MAG: hypothetical protein KAS67_00975 [Thermoplasmata archaeon]|nr:hypothetical protein [Thermoplasmata archaeon]
MTESKLIGYIRKSNSGCALKFSIDAEAFSEAEKFSTKDGREFVQLVANIPRVEDIISGDREVTSLCQLLND